MQELLRFRRYLGAMDASEHRRAVEETQRESSSVDEPEPSPGPDTGSTTAERSDRDKSPPTGDEDDYESGGR